MTREQQAHIESILAEACHDGRRKYEEGQLEHGGNLFEKTGLLDEAIKEALDLVIYLYTLKRQMREKGIVL